MHHIKVSKYTTAISQIEAEIAPSMGLKIR